MTQSFTEILNANTTPLVIGHRGFNAIAPENTLPSFELCLKNNIPAVEFDVHTCGSGELVVIHDDNFKRTTGYDGVVETTPLEEIRKLDAGSSFSPDFKGAGVPLLEEVFDLLEKNVYYDIEIKWKKAALSDLETKLITMIRKFDLEDRCLITSFNPFSLKETRRLAPAIPTGLLYTNDSDELPWILRRGAGRFICRPVTMNPDKHFIGKGYMRYYHRLLKYPVIPFTVNSAEDVRRFTDLGVSGIISDNPGMVMSVLK